MYMYKITDDYLRFENSSILDTIATAYNAVKVFLFQIHVNNYEHAKHTYCD